MMKPLLLLFLFLAGATVPGSDAKQLLARWSFPSGADEIFALTDDSGKLTLKKTLLGNDARVVLNPDGTVLLGASVMLYAPEFNSRNYPELTSSVTLYCRVKYLEKHQTAFTIGLLDEIVPREWQQIACGAFFADNGIRSRITGPQGECGTQGILPYRENDFNDIAVSFDAKAGRLLLYVNGRTAVSEKIRITRLDDFQSFAVGRLKVGGGQAMVLDEVRIYGKALSADEIADLVPPPPPELQKHGTTHDRLVIEDFSDVGTWRTSALRGATPNKWFSLDHCLGAVADPSRNDGFAGKLQFDFSGDGTGELAFSRTKAAAWEVNADGIEFDVDARSISCGFRFLLKDSRGHELLTPEIAVAGIDGWRRCRVELNETACPGFEKLHQPVRIAQIRFLARNVKGANSILIDDLAMTGNVGDDRLVTLKPATQPLAHKPGKPAVQLYQLRNASDKEIAGELTASLTDYENRPAGSAQIPVRIPPHGLALAEIRLPPLPIGSFQAEVEFRAGGRSVRYTDWLGVFIPNGHRLNRRPMYFGICDNYIWQGEGENALHQEWMKLAGFDINRLIVTGDRLEQGNTENFTAFARALDATAAAGMIGCVSYMSGLPSYLHPGLHDGKAAPTDREALKRHVKKLFGFFRNYPVIQYFELWNEPQIEFWHGTLEEYVALLHDFYTVGKPLAPHIQFMSAALDRDEHPRGKKNFSRELCTRLKGICDLAAFHQHGNVEQYILADRTIHEWLKAAGNELRLGNTETGYRSGYNPDSIRQQAEMVVKKLITARSLGNEFFLYFMLQDYWDMDQADDSFGLITSDNRPKPSFLACNEAIRQLADTEREGTLAYPGLTIHRFRLPETGRTVWAIWPEQASNRIPLAIRTENDITAVDFLGRPVPVRRAEGSADLTIPGIPIYLRGGPGEMTPEVPPVATDGIVGCRAGGTAEIPVQLRNPLQEKAEVVLTLPGSDSKTAIELAPGGRGRCTLSLPVKAETANGLLQTTGEAVFRGENGRRQELSFPAAVYVAFPFGSAPVSIRVDQLSQIVERTYDPSVPGWQGPADLSCTMTARREGDDLKLTFAVADDKHCPAATAEQGWNGDGIQFAVATLDGKLTEVTVSEHGVWRHIAPAPEKVGSWKVPFRFRRTATTTFYELSLPIRELELKPGLFRFAFIVNENDGIGRVRWLKCFDGIGNHKDPAEFGWGILE